MSHGKSKASALAALAMMVSALALPGAGADTSLSRSSERGLFVVTVAERPDPVPLNALHAWSVHVESADGVPVNGAAIGIDGGMPMHDHGLPTAPRATALPGDGDYRLEGLKFQMPGDWVVRLEIEADGGSDVVTFELRL